MRVVKKVSPLAKKDVKQKKTSVSKVAGSATKSRGKREMVCVSGEMCFWVHNGPILCSLRDLANALEKMTDEQFSHHVGGSKNDFSLWVSGVLFDDSCAKSLSRSKTKASAVKVVKSALSKYL